MSSDADILINIVLPKFKNLVNIGRLFKLVEITQFNYLFNLQFKKFATLQSLRSNAIRGHVKGSTRFSQPKNLKRSNIKLGFKSNRLIKNKTLKQNVDLFNLNQSLNESVSRIFGSNVKESRRSTNVS